MIIDRIEEGSARETVNGGWEIQRVAYVGDLQGSPPSILVRALSKAGMPQIGDPHPVIPVAKVVGHYAVGAAGDAATVYITYQSPQAPGGSLDPRRPTFVVSDETTLRTVQTQMLNNEPLRCRWAIDNGRAAEKNAQVDTLTIPIEEQISGLVLWGVVSGQGLSDYRRAVGYVNRHQWLGWPVGTWRFGGLSTETQDLGQTYSVTARVERRAYDQDWRIFGLMRSPESGKYLPVKAKDVENVSIRKLAYPANAPRHITFNGGLVAFPYPTLDFRRLFGIG